MYNLKALGSNQKQAKSGADRNTERKETLVRSTLTRVLLLGHPQYTQHQKNRDHAENSHLTELESPRWCLGLPEQMKI